MMSCGGACCACSGRGLAGVFGADPSPPSAAGAAATPLSDSDRAEVGEFAQRFVLMARDSIVLAVAAVADAVGLFAMLTDAPLNTAQIADKGGLHLRYVQEICATLACADFISYDAATQGFSISAAKSKLLTDASFAIGVGGWLQMLPALYRAVPAVAAATLQPGKTTGVPFSSFSEWGFTAGMDRLNSPGIRAAFVSKWLPCAGDHIIRALEQGISVCDLGTGSGALAIALAVAFPKSSVLGVDLDAYSIARAEAAAANLSLSNLRFVVRDIASLAENQFDLVTNHDCIHDLVNPVSVLSAVRRALKVNSAVVSDDRLTSSVHFSSAFVHLCVLGI
jgi:hypothetical protein